VLRPVLAFILIVAGCSKVDEENDTGLPDALNDADADGSVADLGDIDSDGDGDIDSDQGAPPYAEWEMTGRIDYASTSNGLADCDALIGLSGTGFVGECEGCDYAFLVDADVEEDRGSTTDCAYNPLLSFIENGVRENLILAHASEGYLEQDDVDVLVQDLVQVGFSLYYEATETSESIGLEGPFWWQMYYGDISKESTFSRDGNELNWAFRFEDTVATWDGFAMLDDCGEDLVDNATEAIVSDVSQDESIPCDGWQADVWEIVLGPDDDSFEVQIDTLEEDTTFDPAMLINDPEGCVTLYADDGFDCTVPPPAYQCPAGTIEGEPGIYQIIVFSYGQCSGGDVDYRIEISGTEAANTLTLAMNDVDRFENLQFTTKVIDIAGCASIYPEGIPSEGTVCETFRPTDGMDSDGDDTGISDEDTGMDDDEEDTGTPVPDGDEDGMTPDGGTDGDDTPDGSAEGDETGGDETGGDETGGDESSGDESSGDETGGDETGGDETGGESEDDDGTGDEPDSPDL
jgi:hypothetical protein